jgi:hypothetical protein
MKGSGSPAPFGKEILLPHHGRIPSHPENKTDITGEDSKTTGK